MSRMCYLTPAELLRLDAACQPVVDSFRDVKGWIGLYLVGSVMTRADYRDVDVRMVLRDKAFRRLMGDPLVHRLWNVALSQMVDSAANLRGPVDFQVQSLTESSGTEDRTPANPLGKRWRRPPALIDAATQPGGQET